MKKKIMIEKKCIDDFYSFFKIKYKYILHSFDCDTLVWSKTFFSALVFQLSPSDCHFLLYFLLIVQKKLNQERI